MSEQAAHGPIQRDGTATVFHEGKVQHFIREIGNTDSRLVYQGELVDIEQ